MDAAERTTFCAIQLYSPSLHHRRYVDCTVGATCTASGSVACAVQPVSLAHAHNSTRLRDSVRQATSQVQRRSQDLSGSSERSCLARGDCCPPGKGCNRAGPSSRDEAGVLQPLLHRTQERQWSSTNPGFATPEPGPAQAPVQDVDAQAHDQMHTAPGLVCSDRPEGCLLSCFDPSPFLWFAFEGRAWQYRVLPFGLSLSPRVFTKVIEGPYGQHCGCVVHQPDGGIRSRRMSQLARHLLLWSHTRLKSLRAVHIPGELNRAADALSRQLTFPGEWRLHPETIRLIWSRFGKAQVDLFASRESSHCQLYFSLTEGTLGTDALAHSWPRALCKYAFPPVSLLAQTLCKVREDEEQVLLVAPFWPTRTWFPELILLTTAPPWRIPLRKDLLSQGLGTIWHPRPDLWNRSRPVDLFGQDVASVAPFSGRLASPSLLPSCNNKQERREASFIEGRNPFRLLGRGTAAWLSPAAMYSVVPAGTKVSEFALGRWEGCDLSHGICLSRARLSTSACHKVVTGFRLWRFP